MPTREQIDRYNANRRAKYRRDSSPMKASANKCYRKRYGWTPEMYEAKKVEQNNLCAICGNPQEGKELAADHEHCVPPKPRGLLCETCNVGIGMFKRMLFFLKKQKNIF
jgi:hypothetical protein